MRRVEQQCPFTLPLKCTLKTAYGANFTLCVFYHNLKNSTINLHLLCLVITGPPLTVPLINPEGDLGMIPMLPGASLPRGSRLGIPVSWNKSLSCAPQHPECPSVQPSALCHSVRQPPATWNVAGLTLRVLRGKTHTRF